MTPTILLLELSLMAATAYILCIRWGITPAESGAYALLFPLMALTVGVEAAFLAGVPLIGWIWEGFLTIISIMVLIRTPNSYKTIWKHISQTVKAHPAAALGLSLVYLVFLIQFLFSGVESNRMALPGNIHALSYWLALAHGPTTQILPALFAFGAIAFATYALARRYAWPPTAMTVMLMVASMPRLVCLASAGSSEIVHTAGCLLCILILYRLVERPYGHDFFLLLTTLGFCVSMVRLQWLYPLIIVVLATILIIRRHGALFFKSLLSRQNYLSAFGLIPATLFVIYPLLSRSMIKIGSTGNAWELPMNPDGIQGAMANSIRYLLEAIHFTLPVDQLVRSVTSNGIIDLLSSFYKAYLFPLFGNTGAVEPFQIFWAPNAEQAWFGPFGFIVIIPAMLYALLKGPRRLKAVAVSLVGYFFLMTLIPAWKPGNVALFTLLFTLGGFMAAFSLPPWRFSTRNRYVIQTISFLLLFYSLLFNPLGILSHHRPLSF